MKEKACARRLRFKFFQRQMGCAVAFQAETQTVRHDQNGNKAFSFWEKDASASSVHQLGKHGAFLRRRAHRLPRRRGIARSIGGLSWPAIGWRSHPACASPLPRHMICRATIELNTPSDQFGKAPFANMHLRAMDNDTVVRSLKNHMAELIWRRGWYPPQSHQDVMPLFIVLNKSP